jgi:hypothetical protein
MPTRKLSLVTNDDERTELDATYPDRYLECRGLQHRWRVLGYYHANGEVIRSLSCERCGTDRHDRWSPGGARLGSTYDYAEGYSIHTGDRPVRAFEVRAEVLNRVTVYDSADALNQAILSGKRRKPVRKAQ